MQYHPYHHRVPTAVGPVPAAVLGTLSQSECLSIVTFCTNKIPTLWLWLLIPCLPSWIPVITRRGAPIAWLKLLLRWIATALLDSWVCATSAASATSVGWGLVVSLRGIRWARLWVVWLRTTGITIRLVRRCLVGRCRGGRAQRRWGQRRWGTEWMIPGRARRLCASVYVIPVHSQLSLSRHIARRYCELPDVPGAVAIEEKRRISTGSGTGHKATHPSS